MDTLIPRSPPAWRSFRVQTPASPLRDVQIDIVRLTSPENSLERLPVSGRLFQNQSCHVAVVDERVASLLFGPDTVGMTIQEPNGAAVEIIGAVKDHEIAGECRHLSVINQEAGDLYFGGKALGAALIDTSGVRIEIVGIVSSRPLGTFEQKAQPAIDIPTWREHPNRMTLLIRSSMWSRQVMDQLRSKLESVPGNVPTSPVLTPLDIRLLESGFAPLRIAGLIFATSTLTALVLSIIGLLSVQSDTERQRRRELAVRVALGAQRRHIFFMTIKETGQLAFTGILIGTFISAVALRVFTNELSTIGSAPFQVWLLAPILSMLMLIMTATVAGYRALSGEPQTVMREDR
jgi:FtsX-like permease family protein